MKKLRKISLVITTLMLLICMLMSKSYAEVSCKINLSSSKSQAKNGDEIYVYVNVSNIQSERGIIAIGGTITYDKNALTLVSITGENGWSAPFYNEENGKITTTRNGFATDNGAVLKITLKVTGNAGSSAWVEASDFQVSDGNEENNVGGGLATISIIEEKNETPVTPTQPVNPGTTTNNNQNQGTKKPSTNSNNSNKNNNKNNNTTNNNTNTNTVDETNTNITEPDIANENVETNTDTETNTKRNIDLVPDYIIDEDTKPDTSKDKFIIYAICIVGIILVVGIMIFIVKSSSDKDE